MDMGVETVSKGWLREKTEGVPSLWGISGHCPLSSRSFIAVENTDSYCILISSKAVYFLKSGDYVDREAIFLEVKYDDLYHCLVSKDHGKVYVQVTKKAGSTSSGVAFPGPSHQKPMVSASAWSFPVGDPRVEGAAHGPCMVHRGHCLAPSLDFFPSHVSGSLQKVQEHSGFSLFLQ